MPEYGDFERLPSEMSMRIFDIMPARSLAKLREASKGMNELVTSYVDALLAGKRIIDSQNRPVPPDTSAAEVIKGLGDTTRDGYARIGEVSPEDVNALLDKTMEWTETDPYAPASGSLIDDMYAEARDNLGKEPEAYDRLQKYAGHCLERGTLYSNRTDEPLPPDTDPDEALKDWAAERVYYKG